MKKIKNKLIIFVTLIFGFLISNVNAATLNSTNTSYKFERYNPVTKVYKSEVFRTYEIGGIVAYCIEPDVHEDTDNYSEGSWLDLGITEEKMARIMLIGYYGYSYTGHQTMKYRMATQAMMWEVLLGDGSWVKFSTDYWNHGTQIDITNERNEIDRLMRTHYTKPSFDGERYEVILGESITLHDDNAVLSNYNISVTNATYEINGNDLTITPTSDGAVSISMSKKMIYSENYKVFIGDGIQKMYASGNTDPVRAVVNLNVQSLSKVSITKRDIETRTTTPQGQATLRGAKYGVYNLSGTLITTITTNENGYGESEQVVPAGSFYLKELSYSEGYLLDNTKYDFTVTAGQDIVHVDVYEKVIKNYISILKQYDIVNGQTTFLNAESGVKFEIYYPNGNKYGEVTTDSNGYATITMPYGSWRFHQVNTTVGFEKIYDFYVNVNYTSKNEHYYNILNNGISAYLQVFKKDNETNKVIELKDTTFKIQNRNTGQYISQYIGGNVYSEFKTDEHGRFITYLALNPGNYKLIEVSSPNGYLLDENGINFTIGTNTEYTYTTYGTIVTLYYDNTPIKGQIEIHKNGEYMDIKNGTFDYKKMDLEGIEFSIFAKEDIKTSDNNYVFYRKDTLVEKVTTNSDGYAISKKLPLGHYYVVETSTKNEYVLDTTEHDVLLTEKDNKTAVVYSLINMDNYLKKGDLIIYKKDKDDNEPIKDVNFEIYNSDNVLIYSGYTDDSGIISLKDIKIGRYYIVEKTTAYGYLTNRDRIYFDITANKQVIELPIDNERVKGKITIVKKAETPVIRSGMKLELKNIDGIKIGLYANEDIILNNILRFSKDDLVDSAYTDINGNIVFNDLFLGKYYLKELETKDNLILDDNKYYIEIKYKDQYTPLITANKELKNYLKLYETTINKIDKDTNLGIPNAEIELYNDKDELIFKTKTDNNGIVNFHIENSKGELLNNVLPSGKYLLKEVNAPYRYLLNEELVPFEIINDSVNVSINNERVKGQIKLHKDGEKYTIVENCEDPNLCIIYETDNNLTGVKFGLYADEDIILNGVKYFDKDSLVDTATTDEDGNIIFDELYLGKYYIKELSTLDNYVLDENKYDVEVEYKDQYTPLVIETKELKNYLIESDLEFTKMSVSTSEPLPNTLMEIYTNDDVLIYKGRTDENGKIILKSLPKNKYYILEKEAPKGYVLNEEPMWFEVLNNNEIVKATMNDRKIKSTIVIHKQNNKNKPLSNVRIGIYDLDDNLVYEGISDKDGLVQVELEYGKYYYQEIETIKKYLLNDEKVFFDVKIDGEVIESILVNVPKTFKSDYTLVNTFVIFIIGLGDILYGIKKSKK